MIVHTIPCGEMKNLVYVLEDEVTRQCMVVDPAWDVPSICELITQRNLELQAVLLTHGHFDHTEGLGSLLEWKEVPVYMSPHELIELRPHVPELRETEDNQVLELGDARLYVLHTPGHSPGGQCFYSAPHLITGDTLFVDGCGRCDLSGSDVEHMYASLQRIKALPGESIVYPGHDYGHAKQDTLQNQCQKNGYLRCQTEAEFVKKRMRAR